MKGRANFLIKYHLCLCILWGYHKNIFLFIIYNSLEVGLWCDNKFLPPKVIGCRFEFRNQPLKKKNEKKQKTKIKSRAAYQDFSQTPQNMGVLCSRYNLLTHYVFVGLVIPH